MRSWMVLLSVALLTPMLAGCTSEPSVGPSEPNPIEACGELSTRFEPEPEYNPRIEFETSNGTFTVLVHARQVPFTAGHVRTLMQDGTYEDTRFHRLVPGQAIFGGDPRSSSEDRDAWGTGGYQLRTVDELHAFLRHDEPGTVSLASPQPHGAGSQFLITLSPQPGLDDRHPVFGKVIEGMDTVERIANLPTDHRDRPEYGAQIENMTWIDPPADEEPSPELTAYGYDCIEIGEPGDTVEHLVAFQNVGQAVLNGTAAAEVDAEGWNASVGAGESMVIASGQTVVRSVNVTIPEDAEMGSEHTSTVTLSDVDGPASTSLDLTVRVAELGEPAVDQEAVEIHFLGVLDDGRPFDTTEETYVYDPSLMWFNEPPANPEPARLPVEDVGFEASQPAQLVERARLGETVVGFVSPEDAYGSQEYGENNLGGRVLVFQVLVTEAD